MATLKDVAKLAQVSPATVSRVLNKNSVITAKTRHRVEKAMKQLNYVPNTNARNLATSNARTIGVILPASQQMVYSNPFFVELLRGINHVTSDNDLLTAVATGESVTDLVRSITMMTAQNKIEKFILLYSQKNDPILDFLAQSNAKYVLLGKPAKDSWNVCYVDNDNILAGSDVTSYLVKKGHRHIGFLYDDFSQVVQGDRYLGYQRAVIQEGLNEYHLGLNEPADAIGPPLRAFLKQHPQITAMIATDDLLALQVQRQLAQLHLPQAMSLVGFNNSIFAKVAQPQLTSVEVFPVALGEAVAKMIVNLSQQQNAPNNMLTPHQIIERDSVVDLTIGEAN